MGEYKLYVLIDKNDNVHYVGITTNYLILKIYDKSSYRKIRDVVNHITFKDLQ